MNASPALPEFLIPKPVHREFTIRFSTRTSLTSAYARAQREAWIEDCRVDVPRLELWIRMSGGGPVAPERAPARPGPATCHTLPPTQVAIH